MNETFLHLPEADQLEVLQLAAERLGRRAAMLEKDRGLVSKNFRPLERPQNRT
jgi:hypothetical protein